MISAQKQMPHIGIDEKAIADRYRCCCTPRSFRNAGSAGPPYSELAPMVPLAGMIRCYSPNAFNYLRQGHCQCGLEALTVTPPFHRSRKRCIASGTSSLLRRRPISIAEGWIPIQPSPHESLKSSFMRDRMEFQFAWAEVGAASISCEVLPLYS